MKNTTIDLKEAREAALAALEAEGDHVYQHPVKGQSVCSYTDPDGNPSCIVGHVIYRTIPDVFGALRDREWEDSTYDPDADNSGIEVDSFNAREVNSVLSVLGAERKYTIAATQWLNRAQGAQDTWDPWSEAIRVADKGIYLYLDHLTVAEREYLASITTEGSLLADGGVQL